MKQLSIYLKNYKKEIILGPFFKLIEAVFELIVPLIMAAIIDQGIKGHDMPLILRYGVILFILAGVGLASSLTCQYFAAKASQGFGTDLRNAMFAHIQSLSYTEIDQIGTPSLITRSNNDINQLQIAVAMLIRLALRAPFLVIGSCIMAMTIDVQLACIFLVAAPLIALTLYFIMSRSIPLYRSIQKKLDKISLLTRENLDGVRVIRATSNQEHEKQRFAEAVDDLMDTSIQAGKIQSNLNPLTYLIVNFSILAIIYYGSQRVYGGSLTQGEIIAFVSYMTQMLLALNVVANLVVIFTKAAASANRVCEVLSLNSSISFTDQEQKIKKEATAVNLKNVSFHYPQSKEYALENITFELKQGEVLGVIGGTGSGKTTLINLINRFYDISNGEITLFGNDIKAFSETELRSMIGIVPQASILFTGTIRENMQWGKPDATDDEIIEALKDAQAYDFVMNQKNGLDTKVNQGGHNFSGGQRQRLTIARALVKAPKILILDDSSSALDYATDAKLQQSLKQKGKDRVLILISQRANSIRYADQILVLDDGRMAGLGTHDELLRNSEVYHEICASQLSEEEMKQL